MIRPRPGDFVYSLAELETMAADIELVKELADPQAGLGFVFGCLTADGNIDEPGTRRCALLANERHAALAVLTDGIGCSGAGSSRLRVPVQVRLPPASSGSCRSHTRTADTDLCGRAASLADLVTFHRAFDMVYDAQLETELGRRQANVALGECWRRRLAGKARQGRACPYEGEPDRLRLHSFLPATRSMEALRRIGGISRVLTRWVSMAGLASQQRPSRVGIAG
jgi:hypothetical protein